MTDYSKMSDFEINEAVLKIKSELKPLGFAHDADKRSAGVTDINGRYHWFDFCNSWADAGPIILKNRISVIFDGSDTENPGEKFEWCGAISDCHKHQVPYLSNPLRAAMIVFLMMNEPENDS
jgi:hypothetical protein